MMLRPLIAFLAWLAASPVSAQLIANADGTVTDPVTGVVWMGDPISFPDSLSIDQAVANLNTLNQADDPEGGPWRLPTAQEFLELTVGNGVMIWAGPFDHAPGYLYWAAAGDSGYLVYSIYGDYASPSPGATAGLWAVRDAPDGPFEVPVDVRMKDCPADTGQEPSACQDDRSSVSIHILEPLSLIPTNAAPEYGRPNTFKARVTNHSKAWALVGVNFYLWPCGTDGAAIGDQNSTFMGGAPYRLVAPGQSAWFASLNQHVYAGIEPAAWCVGVIAEHRADRSPRPPNILGDNNVASVSLAEMDSRAGSPVCQRYLQRLPGQWLCLIGPVFATPRFPPDPHLPWVPQGVPSWWSR